MVSVTILFMAPVDTLFVDILIPTSVNVHHSLGVPHILRVILVSVTLVAYLALGLEWTQTNDLEHWHTLLHFYDGGSISTCIYKYTSIFSDLVIYIYILYLDPLLVLHRYFYA